MKTPNQIFWEEEDAKAYTRGMRYRSGHACGGNKYHRTRETAEKVARRTARKACPDNPPACFVVELATPTA